MALLRRTEATLYWLNALRSAQGSRKGKFGKFFCSCGATVDARNARMRRTSIFIETRWFGAAAAGGEKNENAR